MRYPAARQKKLTENVSAGENAHAGAGRERQQGRGDRDALPSPPRPRGRSVRSRRAGAGSGRPPKQEDGWQQQPAPRLQENLSALHPGGRGLRDCLTLSPPPPKSCLVPVVVLSVVGYRRHMQNPPILRSRNCVFCVKLVSK